MFFFPVTIFCSGTFTRLHGFYSDVIWVFSDGSVTLGLPYLKFHHLSSCGWSVVLRKKGFVIMTSHYQVMSFVRYQRIHLRCR